jgi:hypothetical protein
MKRTWFQAQIKQDIAINTQNEHEWYSTHKRGPYSIFTKRRHPQAYISQSYQEHSYTSYEHHKQSHNLIFSKSLWHMLQMQSMIQRCKHDMITRMKMQHTYVHQPSQPKLKKEKQLEALLANEQM